MGVKFTIDKKTQQALGVKVLNGRIIQDRTVLIEEVRKEFSKEGPKFTRKALLRDMSKGISPVDGKGKFLKYSTSYKKEIREKRTHRMNAASPTKRRSPVTLRLTGELWNKLKVFTTGGSGINFRMVFDWRDFLADIHNRRGAGRSKAVRRMLPTNSNESFNKEITKVILDRLNLAAKVIAKAFS